MRVYFYCLPAGPPEAANYQHATVCLAEGLRELGVEFHSSCDYWIENPETMSFLLRHNSKVRPEDCDVVVLSAAYLEKQGLPEVLEKSRRRFQSVLIDNADGVRTASHTGICRRFDLVLRCHYNARERYASDRVRPWAFGLSGRMLRELADPPEWKERARTILVNFGCLHPLRRRVIRDVLPRLRPFLETDETTDRTPPTDAYHSLMWRQTGRRHYPAYYQRLKFSAACAAFGGLTPTAWECEGNPVKRCWRRFREGYGRRLLTQWDSWRFWESLAAGAATFHVDFVKYGLILPVMPEHDRHYIGVDMAEFNGLVQRLRCGDDLMDKIAKSGREFALINYSPHATAQRFMQAAESE